MPVGRRGFFFASLRLGVRVFWRTGEDHLSQRRKDAKETAQITAMLGSGDAALAGADEVHQVLGFGGGDLSGDADESFVQF